MRNRLFVALALAAVVALTMAEAQARPGGGRRGGGRARTGGQYSPGARNLGGKLPSGVNNSNLAGKLKSQAPGNQAGNWQNKTSQLRTNFKAGQEPFTPSWYANHPRAWQYTHPHADAWAVATIGVAAAWLGIDATTGAYAAEGDTTYTSEIGQGDEAAENEQAAETLAQEEPGTVDGAAGGGEYLPLGVFALAPRNEHDANALVQLAVNKQGQLRGNYYDVLTRHDQNVSGTLDKKTQRASFQVNPDGNVAFETTLRNLTNPTGTVTLRFDSGKTQQWTLARFDPPAAKTAP